MPSRFSRNLIPHLWVRLQLQAPGCTSSVQHALMQNPQSAHSLPPSSAPCKPSCASSRRFLALNGAEVAGFAPCTRFCSFGAADVALASRFLQHVLHLDQLGLVVLHVLNERSSGVVGAED